MTPHAQSFARFRFVFLPLCSLLSLASVSTGHGAEKISFNRDIRPILSDKCFTCHGPDAQKRKAEFRLDQRDAAFKGGKSELPGLVSGAPDKSEVLTRILSTDADDHMPPKKGGKVLSPQEVGLIRQWISEGAEYQGHWAFTKPVRPPLAGPLGLHPIDGFVTARLAKEGLKLSPEADKATLLRRVSLDLNGIPPTVQELDAFLADRASNAYEKVVDRLLASPRYGERMATQWLDYARYADSNGFQEDHSRRMSSWRDWVLKAFNENQPFNQFTIEQLGGDLLPNPTRDQIVATGFNRNHRINGEGGIIKEEWFIENVIDRIETTGSTWMGLTLGCARCHDHKFDPVSQKEFYQLFAIFNSIEENGVLGSDEVTAEGNTNTTPTLGLLTPEQTTKVAALSLQVDAAAKVVALAEAGSAAAQRKWEAEALGASNTVKAQWTALVASELKSEKGAKLASEAGETIFSSGPQPETDSYTISLPVRLPSVTALRLELLPDTRLPSKGPGRNANGNSILSELRVSVIDKGNIATGALRDVSLGQAVADFSQKDWDVAGAIDGNPDTGWAISPEVGKEHFAIFSFKDPLKLSASGGTLVVHMDQKYAGSLIGKFRLSVTGATAPIPIPAQIMELLKVAEATRSDAQKKQLKEFYNERGNELTHAKATLEALKNERANVKKGSASTMVMRELPTPRQAHILLRGQYDQPGEKVERGLPAALPPLPAGAPMNRLGFAQWLVSGNHPLTSRVWVNRAWEKFFGLGLVKSSDNFGLQSDWPSHPELLDWLATEFVTPSVVVNGKPAQAWDMKALQRLIVTSATYRQSARVTPAQLEKDPDNRLLARGPRFRLGAEILRDSALVVSGLLVEKVGGPSVRPYMPKGVWDETSVYGDLRNYENAHDAGLYRRTLYTVWKRTAAPPTALLFDAPSREICAVKRSRTNTPLQALAMLNEVTYIEAARNLAALMIREGGKTPDERLQWAFRRVTARSPSVNELQILSAGLEAQLVRYTKDPAAATKLITFGESKPPAAIPAADLAAYTVSANVLMNLDEFISR